MGEGEQTHHDDFDPEGLETLLARMSQSSPSGLRFRGAVRLGGDDPAISKLIAGARYILAMARTSLPAGEGRAEDFLTQRCVEAMSATTLPFRREIEGVGKMLDVRTYLARAELGGAEATASLARAGLVGDLLTLDVDCKITGSGAVKAAEVAAILAGDGKTAPPHRALRVELYGEDALGRFSPLTLGRGRKVRPAPVEQAVAAQAGAE